MEKIFFSSIGNEIQFPVVLCIISLTQNKLKSVQKNPVGQETAAAELWLDGFL